MSILIIVSFYYGRLHLSNVFTIADFTYRLFLSLPISLTVRFYHYRFYLPFVFTTLNSTIQKSQVEETVVKIDSKNKQ